MGRGFKLDLKDKLEELIERRNGGQGDGKIKQVKHSGRGWRVGESGWTEVGDRVPSPARVSAGYLGLGVRRAGAWADRTAGFALTPGGGRGRPELPAGYGGVWCPLLDPLKKLAASRSLLCAEPPLPKRLVRF